MLFIFQDDNVEVKVTTEHLGEALAIANKVFPGTMWYEMSYDWLRNDPEYTGIREFRPMPTLPCD